MGRTHIVDEAVRELRRAAAGLAADVRRPLLDEGRGFGHELHYDLEERTMERTGRVLCAARPRLQPATLSRIGAEATCRVPSRGEDGVLNRARSEAGSQSAEPRCRKPLC